MALDTETTKKRPYIFKIGGVSGYRHNGSIFIQASEGMEFSEIILKDSVVWINAVLLDILENGEDARHENLPQVPITPHVAMYLLLQDRLPRGKTTIRNLESAQFQEAGAKITFREADITIDDEVRKIDLIINLN